VLLFKALPHILRSLGESKPVNPSAPPRSAPKQTDEPSDPFDDLMEALGNKPKQKPMQSSPQSTSPPPMVRPPFGKPASVYVPQLPKTPAQPRVFKPMPEAQPQPSFRQPVMTVEPERGDTARVQAELAKQEHNPYFTPVVATQAAAFAKTAYQIAPTTITSQANSNVDKNERTSDMIGLLKNRATIRSAILANEILGTPVGLR
jgi:hypothetical protein